MLWDSHIVTLWSGAVMQGPLMQPEECGTCSWSTVSRHGTQHSHDLPCQQCWEFLSILNDTANGAVSRKGDLLTGVSSGCSMAASVHIQVKPGGLAKVLGR